MDQQVMIKLLIADREYPLKVDAKDEEIVREAGRQLNEQLNAYRQRFKIQEKQDLLAMVAFDMAVERMTAQRQHEAQNAGLHDRLTALSVQLAEALSS